MKPCLWFALFSTLVAPWQSSAFGSDFYAYYTRIPSTEEFEEYSRTGDYADLVVKLSRPEGRLVFWRGASYLPYWETSRGKWFLDEFISRHGDGPGLRTDRVNTFSHVALIEESPRRVVISWRYLPEFEPGNPHPGVDPTRFAEEQFEVYPDGKVTRTLRRGTTDVAAWIDPLNVTTQVLQLAVDGVREISREAPAHSPPPGPVSGISLRKGSEVAPVCEWRFDEAVGNEVVETVTGTRCRVEGPTTLWRKGVSGTALVFDGYNTVVSLPAAQAPNLSGGSLTLEGWLAMGAYPWNWAPLVQQGDEDGYFLGVDSHGYPGFCVKVDGVWEQLTVPNQPPYTDTNHLRLFTWYHVVGTYDRADGVMRLYLNGHQIGNKAVGKGGIQTVHSPVRVGKAAIKRVPTEGTHDTLPSEFGIDGLIDEVRIYNSALNAKQVAAAFADSSPGAAAIGSPDLEKRRFPVMVPTGKFGAVYTHLPYYETWENLFRFGAYPDVVVGFDQLPTKFVFWRGVSFIPMMVNETNQWFTEEFNETGGTAEAPGDCEPMSDKPCYHSHVRVLENHNARVVVQWRYYLENPDHHWANYDATTGWGDVADWYFYIYPDGVATVRMHLFTAKSNAWYEWDEQIAVFGEGQHPESVVRKQPVMTLVNASGQATSYDWNPEPPNPKYGGNVIQMIHFTGQYSPFAIQDFDGGDTYSGERTWYSVFPTWNHWPTAQADSSGRNSSFPDRASHSSISHLFWPMRTKAGGKVPFQEKILMEGMSRQSPKELLPLAKSWLRPPEMEVVADCLSAGYDAAQRAYVLVATGPAPSFRLAASADHPIHNPAFVVRDWNEDSVAQVEIDGVTQHTGSGVRQGVTHDANGRPMLNVWLQRESTAPARFTLRGAKPLSASAETAPMRWAVAPRLVPDAFAVTMEVARLPGVGNEYSFECIAGRGHSSGWLREPVYTDAGLEPETEVAYRVKARDAYLVESGWSSVGKALTPIAPAPVVWKLAEGEGKTIRDTAGKHDGVIAGTATWVPGIAGKALHLEGGGHVKINDPSGLHSNSSFTWAAWIRTTRGGPILARAGAGLQWQPGGKVLFVENGRLRFDVGWVGATGAETPVADGAWHHVAVTVGGESAGNSVRCYVDGRLDGSGSLDVKENSEANLPVKIGFCNEDFPHGQSAFVGDLADVRWCSYALDPEQVRKLAERMQK